MKAFFDYLNHLEPASETRISKRSILRCQKAVAAQMHPQKSRHSLRIALAASAAALVTVTAMTAPQMHIKAKKQWRDTHLWWTPKTEAELDKDMQTVSKILITEQQTAAKDGYEITLTGYASDGFHGLCFLELKVPETFDWSHPYLMGDDISGPETDVLYSVAHIKTDYSAFSGCALTPTADPTVYRAEVPFRYDSEQYLTQEPVTLILPQITLYDETYDFEEDGRAARQNPHTIHIPTGFTMKMQQNDYRTETYDEQYGTVRVTPFGYYIFSYDIPEQARNYKKMAVQLTLPNNTVLEEKDFLERGSRIDTHDYTQKEMEIMNARGEDWQNLPWCGIRHSVFRTPVDPYSVQIIVTIN